MPREFQFVGQPCRLTMLGLLGMLSTCRRTQWVPGDKWFLGCLVLFLQTKAFIGQKTEVLEKSACYVPVRKIWVLHVLAIDLQ